MLILIRSRIFYELNLWYDLFYYIKFKTKAITLVTPPCEVLHNSLSKYKDFR